MPNSSGNAYSLISFSPILNQAEGCDSPVSYTRTVLQNLSTTPSFLSRIPNTYLARFFILDDLMFQGYPHKLDILQSKYLVFTSNFYGALDTYLTEMWGNAAPEVRQIWRYCVGFDLVSSKQDFETYIRRCQLKTTFYFNGSTDDSVKEQLKSLYLKQEFSKFVFEHQGKTATQILTDFKNFIGSVKPDNIEGPTWVPGISDLSKLVKP